MNKDQALILRIKKYGAKELEPVYLKFRDEFMHWAIKNYQCSLEDSKEVFQIAMLVLYQNIESGKLEYLTSTLKTYVFSIGKNKLMELSRGAKKVSYVIPLLQDKPHLDNDLKEERLCLVENMVDKLGDPCKRILQLYYYHNNSMDEISSKLNYKNAETVKNQKYKCLQRLRKLINTEGRSDER